MIIQLISIQLKFIYVLTQNPEGQLQKQPELHKLRKIYTRNSGREKVKALRMMKRQNIDI
jgi:hypothetical protein